MPPEPPSQHHVQIVRFGTDADRAEALDAVAVEEPLEIRLGHWADGRLSHRAISITMRTPGDDFELAAGFLFTEGIVRARDQVREIRHCGRPNAPTNTVRVDLVPGVEVDLDRLQRNFYTTSSCGVCGKSSLEALATGARPIAADHAMRVTREVIVSLPARLRERQRTFEQTGGLHAAALFTSSGALLALREDVGRHNAVDKLVGSRLLSGELAQDETTGTVLFLSGRASFELLQKAVMARVPFVCAVGAPSSLAIEAAREFGVTLLGFVRDGRFNVYAGGERVAAG
jgi:FdhD protein